jgi:hypothetical protein
MITVFADSRHLIALHHFSHFNFRYFNQEQRSSISLRTSINLLNFLLLQAELQSIIILIATVKRCNEETITTPAVFTANIASNYRNLASTELENFTTKTKMSREIEVSRGCCAK